MNWTRGNWNLKKTRFTLNTHAPGLILKLGSVGPHNHGSIWTELGILPLAGDLAGNTNIGSFKELDWILGKVQFFNDKPQIESVSGEGPTLWTPEVEVFENGHRMVKLSGEIRIDHRLVSKMDEKKAFQIARVPDLGYVKIPSEYYPPADIVSNEDHQYWRYQAELYLLPNFETVHNKSVKCCWGVRKMTPIPHDPRPVPLPNSTNARILNYMVSPSENDSSDSDIISDSGWRDLTYGNGCVMYQKANGFDVWMEETGDIVFVENDDMQFWSLDRLQLRIWLNYKRSTEYEDGGIFFTGQAIMLSGNSLHLKTMTDWERKVRLQVNLENVMEFDYGTAILHSGQYGRIAFHDMMWDHEGNHLSQHQFINKYREVGEVEVWCNVIHRNVINSEAEEMGLPNQGGATVRVRMLAIREVIRKVDDTRKESTYSNQESDGNGQWEYDANGPRTSKGYNSSNYRN